MLRTSLALNVPKNELLINRKLDVNLASWAFAPAKQVPLVTKMTIQAPRKLEYFSKRSINMHNVSQTVGGTRIALTVEIQV